MVMLAHGSQSMLETEISISAGALVSLQLQSLKSSLVCRAVRVLRGQCTSDRRLLFACDKSELTRGTPRGEGGGQTFRQLMPTYRRHPHAQIFFLVPGVLIQSNEIKQSKAESFQWRGRRSLPRKRHLFSRAPGGRPKGFSIAPPDRWARRTHLFENFRDLFFQLRRPQKSAAKFRVGG